MQGRSEVASLIPSGVPRHEAALSAFAIEGVVDGFGFVIQRDDVGDLVLDFKAPEA